MKSTSSSFCSALGADGHAVDATVHGSSCLSKCVRFRRVCFGKHANGACRPGVAWLSVCLILAITVLGTAAAAQTGVQAQPATDAVRREAAEHFRAGREHFDRGEFEPALREITRSYELVPIRALLYNIAVAQRRLGDLDSAIRSFELYLSTRGDAVAPERRAEVEQLLAELRGATVDVRLEVSVPAGSQASVFIDRRPTPGPWTRAYRLAPGPHDIRAEGDGLVPIVEHVNVSPGAGVTVRLALERVVTAGSLIVALTGSPPNVRVYVDDERVDGWARGAQLERGTRSLRVEADGYQTHRQAVVIVGGRATTVTVPMVLAAVPFYRHAGFLVPAGVLAAGAIAGVIAAAVYFAGVPLVYDRRPGDDVCTASTSVGGGICSR